MKKIRQKTVFLFLCSFVDSLTPSIPVQSILKITPLSWKQITYLLIPTRLLKAWIEIWPLPSSYNYALAMIKANLSGLWGLYSFFIASLEHPLQVPQPFWIVETQSWYPLGIQLYFNECTLDFNAYSWCYILSLQLALKTVCTGYINRELYLVHC